MRSEVGQTIKVERQQETRLREGCFRVIGRGEEKRTPPRTPEVTVERQRIVSCGSAGPSTRTWNETTGR